MSETAAASIDLRSDSFTLPTPEMWDAMRGANLGWASAREDSSVLKLEEKGAELAGKEACLFALTGNMANLVAIMSHTERGDQVLVEASSHVRWCEEWGMTYVGGVFPTPIEGRRGSVPVEAVQQALEASLYRHRPRTSLLCLENTDNIFGAAVTPEEVSGPAELARGHGVSVHIDGARITNACVALDVTLARMLASVDSAMIGLNKGLSAPGGALLVGSSAFIEKCRVNLKRIGGASYHQGGILAAAGLVALETMGDQLRDDHRRAKTLARQLEGLAGLRVSSADVETNIVVAEMASSLGSSDAFVARLSAAGLEAYISGPASVRFVTHRHVGDADIARAAEIVANVILEMEE